MGRIGTPPTGDDVVAVIEDGLTFHDIEARWRRLEAVARPAFFLSWAWIGCWLMEFDRPPAMVVARRAGEIVGLGLVGRRTVWRRLVPIKGAFLHEAGEAGLDGLLIEYNGFLCADALAEAACLRALGQDRGWDELRLSGVPHRLADAAAALGPSCRVLKRSSCPWIDLDGIRRSGSGYLQSLSANTRQQVRRSMRLYAGRGPLALVRPGGVAEALSFLDGLKALHQEAWRRRGLPGAFAAPMFERFHRRLIATTFAGGAVDLIRVDAGAAAIGYLYNFRHDGRAYSYQSGFAFEDDARHKPGLVSHALAAEDYLSAGLSAYRLLAGDHRYKRSLANADEDLYWLAVQRDRWLFRAEALARRVRERVRGNAKGDVAS